MNKTLLKLLIISTILLAFSVSGWAKQTGWVFISSEKDNTITVLDGKTQQQLALINTCKRPRHMQLTADGMRLIVACGDDGRADIIDVAKKQVMDSVKLEEGAEM